MNYLLDKKGRGSQTAVAIDAGISQPQLNKIKSGAQAGNIDDLHAIAHALDTTYEEMLVIGRRIIKGEPSEAPESEPPRITKPVSADGVCSKLKTLDKHDLQFIADLVERFLKNNLT